MLVVVSEIVERNPGTKSIVNCLSSNRIRLEICCFKHKREKTDVQQMNRENKGMRRRFIFIGQMCL